MTHCFHSLGLPEGSLGAFALDLFCFKLTGTLGDALFQSRSAPAAATRSLSARSARRRCSARAAWFAATRNNSVSISSGNDGFREAATSISLPGNPIGTNIDCT
jgi:hypothetical protein